MNPRTLPSVFHIGFHKTGTTYLQESIFPFAVDSLITRGRSNLRDLYNLESKGCWFHSDESISGKPWGSKVPYDEAFKNNLSMCIESLGVRKYIITVRPLDSWTKSLWKQYIHEGGYIQPRNFFNGDDPVVDLEACLMAPKVNWLKERAEVLLLSQQELRDNEFRSIQKISDFTGIRFDLDKIQKSKLKKQQNAGVSSKRQVQFLLKANLLNKKLEHVHPRLSLNNRYLRRLGLTPRAIAQNRLSGSTQELFEIDFDFSRSQYAAMVQDWEKIENQL